MTTEEVRDIVLKMFRKEKRLIELNVKTFERERDVTALQRVITAEEKFLELTGEKNRRLT